MTISPEAREAADWYFNIRAKTGQHSPSTEEACQRAIDSATAALREKHAAAVEAAFREGFVEGRFSLKGSAIGWLDSEARKKLEGA